MKDIKKEKKENQTNWWERLGTAGELASTGLLIKNMLHSSEPVMPVIQNYVGPAVGMPISGGAIARQAFQGLVEEAIPAVGAEAIAAGAGVAVGEVATGGLLLPALGIGAAALAAGSGLYH